MGKRLTNLSRLIIYFSKLELIILMLTEYIFIRLEYFQPENFRYHKKQ